MPGRPGAGMSAGMRNVPLLVRKKKRNVDTSQQELRGAAMDIFGPNKGDREDVAAMILQRAVIRKLIGHNATFGKEKLIERLHLELKLMRGLRLLALCLCMFAVVIFAAVHEKQGHNRLGLLNTYKSLFQLDDSLAEIKTIDDLFDYLRLVSSRSRLIQPTSSQYFVEHAGELKLMQGVRSFEEPEAIEKAELLPRIDSPAFSLMAWVQLNEGEGKYLLRKPLGKTPAEKPLSCWAWYVGFPTERVEFGAHDCGRSDELSQETVSGNHGNSRVADGNLHNVVLVVTSTQVQFFMDATLQWQQNLPRPITDCSGKELEIGDENVPTLGEITFFARALTAEEMEEIMTSGFTLQSIAAGKLPYAPQESPFDNAASFTDQAFATAQSQRGTMHEKIEVEGALSRQAAAATAELAVKPGARASASKIAVSKLASCARVDVLGDETSCHVVTLHDSDVLRDTGGKEYFNMIFPTNASGYRVAGNKTVMYLDHNYPGQRLSYDATKFPSFCGRSATFAIWWETQTPTGGTVLSRHRTADASWRDNFFSLYVNQYGCSVYGGNSKGSARRSSSLPTEFGMPLGSMSSDNARHVVFVFNKDTDVVQFYLDGHVLGSHQYPAGFVGEMDCGMDSALSYTGLGHRLPGSWAPVGPVRDWRYYREALGPADILALASNSTDENGNNLRTCVLPHEKWDQDWEDLDGHDCGWYAEQRQTLPHICASEAVRANCPIACAAAKPCWQGDVEEEKKNSYTIWNRIMFLSESKRGAGVICGREGVDIVEECRVYKTFLKANPSASAISTARGTGAMGVWRNGYFKDYMDVRVDDCEVLKSVVNPYCSFAVPGDWTRKVNEEIKQNAGYTIDFWWKALEGTKIPASDKDYKANAQSSRRFAFFSSVSPTKVFLTIEMRYDFVEARFFGSCGANDIEDAEIASSKGLYTVGEWQHFAAVFGGRDAAGKRNVMMMLGLKASFDLASFEWCQDTDKDFIQAIQMPGNIMVSPMIIESQALTVTALQARYYTAIPKFRLRRGPAVDDVQRMTSTIPYERSTYSYHMSLVAPPILLQTRDSKTATCSHELGTYWQKKTWTDTVQGGACRLPYECDEDLKNQSTALLACSADRSPTTFFGHAQKDLGGKPQFYEFLQSITDASILVRDGKPLETDGYIDAQTKSVAVTMISYAADFGIASTISITALLGSAVSVDYEVRHFQSLEGEHLQTYRNICIIGYLMAALILIEKVVTVLHKDTSRTKVLLGLATDCVVQIFLPVVYFTMRYTQIAASAESILETVGERGFAGVPWSSRDQGFEEKVQSYFNSMLKFEKLLQIEDAMSVFYFIHGTSALLRVLVQTSAHPRTAILVDTFIIGFTDLWHFFILFFLIQFGFIFLAIAQFSDTTDEFSDLGSSFEALWDMFLGSMLESGDLPSSMWTSNEVLMIFLLIYNIIIFMCMLNFIIAIIIDAYMKVVTAAKIQEADQEFFTDVISIVNVSIKSWLYNWPGHIQLIRELDKLKTSKVEYMIARRIFPDKGRRSLMSFLQHYARYPHMAYVDPAQKIKKDYEATEVGAAVEEMTRRMSVMLGVPVPTMAEMIMENKRLTMIGDNERLHRLFHSDLDPHFKKKMGVLRKKPLVPPTIIPKHTDHYVVQDFELNKPASACVNSDYHAQSRGVWSGLAQGSGEGGGNDIVVQRKAISQITKLTEQVERLENLLLQMSGADVREQSDDSRPKIELVSLKEPLSESDKEGRQGRGGGGPAAHTRTHIRTPVEPHGNTVKQNNLAQDNISVDTATTETEAAGVYGAQLPVGQTVTFETSIPSAPRPAHPAVLGLSKEEYEERQLEASPERDRPVSVEISQEPHAPTVSVSRPPPEAPTASSTFQEARSLFESGGGRRVVRDSPDTQPAFDAEAEASATKSTEDGGPGKSSMSASTWASPREGEVKVNMKASLTFDDSEIQMSRDHPPKTPPPKTPSSSTHRPPRHPEPMFAARGDRYARYKKRSPSDSSSSSDDESSMLSNLTDTPRNFVEGAVNWFREPTAELISLFTPRGAPTASPSPPPQTRADSLWDAALGGTRIVEPHLHRGDHNAQGGFHIPLAGYQQVSPEYGEG